jgi:hypothetical protein
MIFLLGGMYLCVLVVLGFYFWVVVGVCVIG